MSTLEIKDYLHRLIVETDDVTILSRVHEYFQALKNEIPVSQINEVKERVASLKNGQMNTKPWDNFKKDFSKK